MWTTLVKSLSDTQPDFGCASGPVDVQRYVEGRAHVPGGDDGGVDGGVTGGEDGGVDGLEVTGAPVQATPLSAKPDGSGLLPFHEPLKPKP